MCLIHKCGLYTSIYSTKLLLHQYPQKEPSSMAHLVQGLGKLIVQVQCKVHQQMIRWSGNLGRISRSEKVTFQMVTERNYRYAVWWLHMFREWIPKSRERTWKSSSLSMSFNPGNKWKPDEWSSLDFGAKESVENRYESSPEEKDW